jgi:hypothetical protein
MSIDEEVPNYRISRIYRPILITRALLKSGIRIMGNMTYSIMSFAYISEENPWATGRESNRLTKAACFVRVTSSMDFGIINLALEMANWN